MNLDIKYLLEGYDLDRIEDADFACREMGETAAEEVLNVLPREDVFIFIMFYNKYLHKMGIGTSSNKECPTPDNMIDSIPSMSKGIKRIFQKVQEIVDNIFDEGLFISLADGNKGEVYTKGTYFPFAPYNRYWHNFYFSLVDLSGINDDDEEDDDDDTE